MVLQTRRKMKIIGIKVSFLSATDAAPGWEDGALDKMGRYSERAACWKEKRESLLDGIFILDVSIAFCFKIL